MHAATPCGRRKLAQFRALAAVQGWLDAEAPLPDEAQIAAALEPAKQAASTVSSLESHRQRIQEWLEQSVPATALLDRLLHHAIVIPIEGNFGMSANSASAFAPGGSPMSETQCLSERDIRIARVLRSLGTAPMTRQQAERAGRLLGLHSSTVYKLRRRFLRHPVTSAVAPMSRGCEWRSGSAVFGGEGALFGGES